MTAITTDLDFVTARLHARRSRMAEGKRLDDLCHIRTMPELGRALYPETGPRTAVDLQRRLVADTAAEVGNIAGYLGGAEAEVLNWLCVRFQMENLKVLARGFSGGLSVEEIRPYLVPLPAELEPPVEPLLAAESLEAFANLIPAGALAESVLRLAVEPYKAQPRPFFIESALDHGYLAELTVRGLTAGERGFVMTLVRQEVETFHMLLTARGRFYCRITTDVLKPFYIGGLGAGAVRVSAMAGAADLADLARRSLGHAIDFLPPAPAVPGDADARIPVLEALAWNRFWRAANQVFRASHIGLGAVVGYVGLRRVELANLITLTEGIRAGLTPDAIRRRMIPRSDLEAAHV